MNNKMLCCMIEDASQEEIDNAVKALKDNPDFIVHNEHSIFYYPSNGMPHDKRVVSDDIRLHVIMAIGWSMLGFIIGVIVTGGV